LVLPSILNFTTLQLKAHNIARLILGNVATPLWAKCEDETHTPKSGNLESSGTPENSKLDCRGQNTSHLGVLDVIGEVMKCRCSKWPRMCHLDISNPSYGQKKGRESTRSRRALGECNMALESSRKELQDWFRAHPDQRSGGEVVMAQSPVSPNRDNFETPLWEFRDKKPLGRERGGATQRILYGGRWWLPSSPGRGESSESKVARGLSQHQKGAE
jgi:hypothetical protein